MLVEIFASNHLVSTNECFGYLQVFEVYLLYIHWLNILRIYICYMRTFINLLGIYAVTTVQSPSIWTATRCCP